MVKIASKSAAAQHVAAQIEQSSLASEEARLAALLNYKLLDTPPETALDNITQLAAALCETPVAFISLVDRERLFFKSRVGSTDISRPRQGAFCDVVVREQMPLIVNSARDDARFNQDEAVTKQGLQFYAGMPLVTAEGHVLGSLCVFDTKPRALQDSQKTALEGLARQVVNHIDARAQVQRLQDKQVTVRIDAEVFRSVLASSQEAVVITDDAGTIQQWGGTAASTFGYSESEIVGNPFASLFVLSPIVAYNQSAGGVGSLWGAVPEHYEVGADLMQRLLHQSADAPPQRAEVYGRRKDGSVCFLDVTGSRFGVDMQSFSCWVIRDISGRHQSDQQRDTIFRTSMVLSSLRNLPQAAPQLLQLICMGLEWDSGNFWVEDAEQGRLVCAGSWSRRREECLAHNVNAPESCIVEAPIAEDDLLATTWAEGAPTWIPDVNLDDHAGMRIADSKTRSLVCVPLVSINECYGVLELTSEAVKPCDQDTMHCLLQVANQTGQFLRRYSVEQSMRASEQRFRSLFISTAVSMALLSSKGTMEAVNQALCAMLGREESQLIGQSFFRSVTFEDPEGIKAATQAMLAGKLENFQCQVQCQHREGHMVWAAANISIMQNENRANPGFVVQMLDMTAQRRSAEAMHRAKEMAEAATRAKSDFLARMSHEIRTPINGVIGMADLTMQTALSFEQGQYLSVLRSSATSLLALVNDVLDFSKNEAGRMTLEEIPFSVRSLLEQASAALMVRAREKDLSLKIEVGEDVPDRLKGDPQRLQQILVNLMANAVKFTLKGSVTARVTCDDVAEGRVRLTFGVEDTGIGISTAEKANLFKAFGQGNDTTHRRFGGTGLGLAICQQLVELMGGRIWIDSEPNVGSTFFFSLSLPEDTQTETVPTAAVLAAASATRPRRTLKVLVAEDNAVNRMVASGLLGKAGHAVTLVEDGHQAVAALADGHGFDIVLMDLQMPLMGGLEATKTIRMREKGRGLHVPIVALTAQAMDGDQDACLQAGMDAYLTKPLNLTELLHTLEVYTAMADDTSKSMPSTTSAQAASSVMPYDRAELLERLSGDEELFSTIVEVFVSDLGSMQDGLHQAVSAHDAKRIEQAAHKLKGALLNLSAGPAAGLAKSLEDMGRAGVLDAPELKVAALDQALAALQNALTQGTPRA